MTADLTRRRTTAAELDLADVLKAVDDYAAAADRRSVTYAADERERVVDTLRGLKGRLLTAAQRRRLDGLRHTSRHLNQPMLNKLRACADDDSPNWDGRITIYPPEASGLVTLIDAAEALAAEAEEAS